MRDALSESLYTLLDHLNRQWSQPQVNILDVIKNEFLHNLKTDHIAVDHTGTPIARAADRAAVERAAPNAAAYFSGTDFEPVRKPVAVKVDGQWKATAAPLISPATAVTGIPATGQPPVTAPAPVSIPPIERADLPPDPNLPTEPYPTATSGLLNATAVKPSDEQTQTASQVSDKDDPAAPETTTAAKSPAKLN